MGRTIPSYRNQLEKIIKELAVYRRALRGEDKIAFDDIMNRARQHASSCTLLPLFDPVDCLLLSIILEQEKDIKLLKEGKYKIEDSDEDKKEITYEKSEDIIV